MQLPAPLDGEPLFAQWIRRGDRIVCGQVAAEPLSLTRALVAQRASLPECELFLGTVLSDSFTPLAGEPNGPRLCSYGAMGRAALLGDAGKLDVLPVHYHELESAFSEGRLRADVALIQLAAPRGHGPPPSLGLANDYVAAAARKARIVIAELSHDVPWSHDAVVDFPVHAVVHANTPPIRIEPVAASEVESRIAAHVAERIPDGAVLQTGIGALPDAVLAGLRSHRNLGIHTGLLADRFVELIECGAVTNAHKPLDTGLSVTNVVAGSGRTHRHVDDNASVRVRPAAYTHAFEVLAALPGLHAINSVLEVDLSGQANAESLAGRARGGCGGLNAFVRGARAAAGGRSVLVLPATADGGRRSRIVARLADAVATVPRCDADLVVTELGVADLRDCSLTQRAQRMIEIAAPQFREELRRSLRDPMSTGRI